MDPNNPNDPLLRERDTTTNTTVVDRRSSNGVTWFIVAVLVVAAGVLAYMYYGDNTDTAQTPQTTIEGQSETGRATTDEAPTSTPAPSDNSGAMAPSDNSSAPPAATPAPSESAPSDAAPSDSAPSDSAPSAPPAPGGASQ